MLSLIGALRHDTDEQHTIRFIIDFVMTYLNSVDIMDVWDIWEVRKPSLLVAQILKSNGFHGFDFRVLRETGTNTILPTYVVGIYVNQKLLGFGGSLLAGEQAICSVRNDPRIAFEIISPISADRCRH